MLPRGPWGESLRSGFVLGETIPWLSSSGLTASLESPVLSGVLTTLPGVLAWPLAKCHKNEKSCATPFKRWSLLCILHTFQHLSVFCSYL